MSIIRSLERRGDTLHTLMQLAGGTVYPRSVCEFEGAIYFLVRGPQGRRLGILSPSQEGPWDDFDLSLRQVEVHGQPWVLGLGATNHTNAQALRRHLPFAAPIPLGLKKSAGLGDRLGIATPGHIRALRHAKGIAPILAQQSIREMERTQRTPDDVMDTATWGVFQEGWRDGYGADADHLKTREDIDRCVAAGFVTYTLDPRDHVDNAAHTDDVATLQQKFSQLPWAQLETTPEDTLAAYASKSWSLTQSYTLAMSEEQVLRAACKYGRALAHLVGLYRYLVEVMGDRPFELEISVDEADTPTSPEEHFYIASELRRLGVEWVSLAPRYVGRFEKGVDYIGDRRLFASHFERHVAIARTLGPYKLSLHSGSDKFSIYPIVAQLAGNLIHLKTAGTSYLEALRAVARVEPALFREILAFAIAHYEKDRASYHVSADMRRVPAPDTVPDAELPNVLDQFDARQALHVTFGSVLTATDAHGQPIFRDRLYQVLEGDEEAHYAALEAHLARHLRPFSDYKR